VTRQRLRPAHSPEELAEIYARPHDHTQWQDHVVRVEATIDLAQTFEHVRSAADLSCGSGAVLGALDVPTKYFGDFASGYRYTGPIEQTIEQIPSVDLFINTETLEHLDDPDDVLKRIRAKTTGLVLSTPVDAWDDENREHYWAWSAADVEEMLAAADFEVCAYVELDFRSHGMVYDYGIWACR
jgi:hypothetical protein